MRDRWVRVLSVLMALVSLPLLLMLVLTPLAVVRVLVFDLDQMPSDDRMVFWIMMPFSFALGVYGLALALVARGLWRRKPWAGFWGTAVCISWFPLGLLPFGVFGLWVLLRRSVRDDWNPKPKVLEK